MPLFPLNSIPSNDQMIWDSYMNPPKNALRFSNSSYNYILSETSRAVTTSNACVFTKKASSEIIHYPSSYLAVGVAVACTQRGAAAALGAATLGNQAFVGYKAPGSLSLINQVKLSVNGKEMTENSDYHSHFMWLKYITSASESWHRTNGSRLFMGSELPEAEILAMQTNLWTASDDISTYGNITITPAITADSPVPADIPGFAGGGPLQCNRAFLSRCFNISGRGCRDMTVAATSVTDRPDVSDGRLPFILPIASTAASTTASVGITQYHWAVIPLPFIHDFFDKIGLRAYLDFNLQIKMNNCLGIAPAVAGTSMVSVQSCPGTCPVMMSTAACAVNGKATAGASISSQGNAGAIGVVPGVYSNDAGVIVNNNAVTQTYNNASPVNCELWLLNPELTAEQAAAYLSTNHESVRYCDFSLSDFDNQNAVPARTNFTHKIQGSVSPRKIYMLVNTASQSTLNDIPVDNQCISSEGYYSTPGLAVKDIQVLVESTNLYPQQLNYTYQQFEEELGCQQGSQGGASIGLGTGLYSKQAWNVCRLYVFDLTRLVVSGSNPTISVKGTSCSPVPMRCRYFVEYQKEAKVQSRADGFTVVSVANV